MAKRVRVTFSNPAASAAHVNSRRRQASIDFSGEVIAGSLPRRALALVAEWAALHQDALVANWEQARRDEPLEPIEPLP
jgi:hypothetical protein